MRIKIVLMLLICLTIVPLAISQENPPTAQEISNQIQTYWKDYKFDELEAYINQLYQNYPNYIPAILAKSFYHAVYRNNPTDSLNELNSVVEVVNANPLLGSEDFREMLEWKKHQLVMSIETHQRKGITQEQRTAVISVKAVRDTWGDRPLPDFELIALAPNESR